MAETSRPLAPAQRLGAAQAEPVAEREGSHRGADRSVGEEPHRLDLSGCDYRDRESPLARRPDGDRKSTRLNSSHVSISYAVFCLKKKKEDYTERLDDQEEVEDLSPIWVGEE